jgi:hypothetical protein
VNRLPDWPERLAALITAAEHRPFDAERWNCGRFAMAAVVVCTGQRPSWKHRPSLAEMADTAGYPRVPVPFARAGDVVLASDPDRLGVVLDAGCACPSPPAPWPGGLADARRAVALPDHRDHEYDQPTAMPYRVFLPVSVRPIAVVKRLWCRAQNQRRAIFDHSTALR